MSERDQGPRHETWPNATGPMPPVDRLPPDDSFATDMRDPQEAERMRSLEEDNARLKVARAAEAAQADRALQPTESKPGTEFEREMAQEERLVAQTNGMTYGVFHLNQEVSHAPHHTPGRPVVLLLGLLGNAQRGEARDFAYEFSLHNAGREVIIIQREGVGTDVKPSDEWAQTTDAKELGESRLNILNQLGVEDFDVVGYSFGAVAAAGLAAEAGDRVHTLVTFGLPGIEDTDEQGSRDIAKSIAREMMSHPGRVAREFAKRMAGSPRKGKADAPTGPVPMRDRKEEVRTIVDLGRMMLERSNVADQLGRLAPSTHWTDIVGDEDATAPWRHHLSSMQERNRAVEHGSDIVMLSSKASKHMAMSKSHALMAEFAADALTRQARRERRSADSSEHDSQVSDRQ